MNKNERSMTHTKGTAYLAYLRPELGTVAPPGRRNIHCFEKDIITIKLPLHVNVLCYVNVSIEERGDMKYDAFLGGLSFSDCGEPSRISVILCGDNSSIAISDTRTGRKGIKRSAEKVGIYLSKSMKPINFTLFLEYINY